MGSQGYCFDCHRRSAACICPGTYVSPAIDATKQSSATDCVDWQHPKISDIADLIHRFAKDYGIKRRVVLEMIEHNHAVIPRE